MCLFVKNSLKCLFFAGCFFRSHLMFSLSSDVKLLNGSFRKMRVVNSSWEFILQMNNPHITLSSSICVVCDARATLFFPKKVSGKGTEL